jgi:hypothetical protein
LQSEAEQHGSAKYAYRYKGRAFDDTDAVHVILYGRLPFAKKFCVLLDRLGCSFISGLVAVDISLLALMESADPRLISLAGC